MLIKKVHFPDNRWVYKKFDLRVNPYTPVCPSLLSSVWVDTRLSVLESLPKIKEVGLDSSSNRSKK